MEDNIDHGIPASSPVAQSVPQQQYDYSESAAASSSSAPDYVPPAEEVRDQTPEEWFADEELIARRNPEALPDHFGLSSVWNQQTAAAVFLEEQHAARIEEFAPATSKEPAKAPAPEARTPTSLEASLSAIRLDGARQERFVMLGDPAVERRFYLNLAEDGLLSNRGGTPIIHVSTKEAMRRYTEAAQQEGQGSMQAVAALDMTLRRGSDDRGIRGVLNEIKSRFGLDHRVVVMVAGSESQRAEKLQELGSMLSEMKGKQFFSADGAAGDVLAKALDPDTNALKNPEAGPVKLDATRQLVDLVAMAQSVVESHKQQEQEKDRSRKEVRTAAEDKKNAEAAEKEKAKQAEASAAAALNAPGAYSPFAGKIFEGVSHTLRNPSEWDLPSNAGIRPPPEAVLTTLSRLKDPDTPEFATLPPVARETMLLEAAILVRKVDAGVVGESSVKALDTPHVETGATPREKLDQLLLAERGMSPELMKSLERRAEGMLSEEAWRDDPQLRGLVEALKAENAAAAVGAYEPAHMYGQARQQEAEVMPGSDASEIAIKLEAMAKRDPKDVTEGEMGSLLTELSDAKGRLHRLDDREYQEPTETLARAEAVINAAAEGRFGPANQALAETFKEPLTVWKADDALRYEVHPDLAHTSTQEVAAKIAAAEPQWHGGVEQSKAPVQDGAEPTKAPAAESVSAIPESAKATEQATEPAPAKREPALHQGRYLDDPFGLSAPAKREPARAPAQPQEQAPVAASVGKPEAVAEAGPNKLEVAPVEAPGKATESVTAESPAKAQATVEAVASKPAGEATAESPGKAPEAVKADAAKATQEATAESPAKAQAAVEAASSKSAVEATAESAPAIPKEAAPVVVSAQAQQDTDAAMLRLSGTLKNPAGLLTTQDKQWDQKGIDRTAKAIARLDAGAVATMSPEERTKVHAVAQWVADNAAAGKLPGFDTEKGQELLAKVQSKVAELAPLTEGSLDDVTRKQLGKADAMVGAMEARERGMTERLSPAPAKQPEAATAAERNPGVAPTQTAKDLVDAIYSGKEISEAYAKYLLKSGSQLSAADVKSLDPETRARATVALDELSKAVKGGALGEFDTLSAAVQRHANGAAAVADKLFDTYKNDPEMKAPLMRASMALTQEPGEVSKAAAKPESQTAAAETAKDAAKAKSAEMER